MKAGKGRKIMGKVASKLLDYTRTHFRDEDRLLESRGYPGLTRQREQHARLTGQVEELGRKI